MPVNLHKPIGCSGRCRRRCRGNVLVLVALLLVVLMGIMALAVDLGYLYAVQSNLQGTADSAALAGASGLGVSETEARTRATDYAQKNLVNGSPVVLKPEDIQLGLWDATLRAFTPTNPSAWVQPNAIKVTPRLYQDRNTAVNLFFARALGHNSADVSSSAVAVFGSRDIVVVLDYSASMSYDSQFMDMSRLGRTAIEQGIRNIWEDLGSKTYGRMQYTPRNISSTNSNTTLKLALGLTNVPYPYPGGSWDEYINYVQTDSTIRSAGYANCYGYLTLVNYWQSQRYKYADTPDLWKTREQPVTAVKDALSVFLAFMQQVPTDDRVGLVSYTYTDNKAKLEVPLTNDYSLIESTADMRQAGHYQAYTNIAAGIRTGRTELMSRGRTGASQLLVLLTDGNANLLDNGTYDLATAKNNALDEARQAALYKFPIVTISLGSDADTALMQQIADITGGIHFIVPGGRSVSDYRDQLMAVFAQIATARPLKLVD